MTRWALPLVALLGVALGGGGMLAWNATRERAPAADRVAVEGVVRDYLLTHPEVIPEAMQRLQDRETGRALAAAGNGVTRPYAGAWAGDPEADVTLVEYYDYNCGYCRASLPVLRQLLASDPDLRIVFRELPVLAPTSRDAARASLAAAEQNRFMPFHDALYELGRVTPQTIATAARQAGVDLSRLDMARADAEIARNLEAAGRLGLNGTPSWVVGDRVLSGALPLDELRRAIAAARAR